MKVLMIGPGRGHNIRPFLDYYREDRGWRLDFLSLPPWGYSEAPADFLPLRIHEYRSFWLQVAPLLWRNRYDLVWIQGGNDPGLLRNLCRFTPPGTKLLLNIWSETWLKESIGEAPLAAIRTAAIRRADLIQCNWYGTQKLLRQLHGRESVVLPWGIPEPFLTALREPAEPQPFTRDFLASLPSGKALLFYPKSMLPGNRHDLLVDTAELLLGRGVADFELIFWLGNVMNEGIRSNLSTRLETSPARDRIRIVEHPFLPDSDMVRIWRRMTVGLSILDADQLSTTFVEPLAVGCETIASRIYAYTEFDNRYGTRIPLVDNTAESIATALTPFIHGQRSDPALLAHRQSVVQEHFSFTKNLHRMTEHHQRFIGGTR